LDYQLKIAGLTRSLTIYPITEEIGIAAFILFGDVELTCACAEKLLEKAPEYDFLLTAEAKGIPLVYEMARQSGKPYLVARKSKKLYMGEAFSAAVKSISTAARQTLLLDRKDAEAMRGKRILIVDDVISTGESLLALETLAEQAGGVTAARMAVLAEGKASLREDIIYLEKLPLFNSKGDEPYVI